MKVLLIHAKEFRYRPIKRAQSKRVEEADDIMKKFENALVAFLTIEEGDFKDRDIKINELINVLIEKCKEIKPDYLVVYPYAHLSNRLEDPVKAVRILKMIDLKVRDEVSKTNIKYDRAPFGWYKEFMIHCLGHPLAEAFREI